MNGSTRRSSDPVDPLQDFTVLALCPKSLKVLPDPSKTADFGGDLHAAQIQIKAMDVRNRRLIDLAKNIVNGASETHKSGNRQIHQQKDAVFLEKAEANRRERRPIDAGRKRGRFSMKPATNLLPPFDVKKYKDADECFRAFDRHENARKEIEKQLGGAVLEPAPPTKRIRQPLGMSVKQKHHYPLFNFEPIEKLISTQETFKTSIPSPVNQSLQTEPSKNVVLDEVDVADSTVEADDELRVSNQIVSKPAEDAQGEREVCSLIEECFNITPFEIDELCLSESPNILESDFVSHRRTSLRPTDTDNFVKGSSKTHSKRTKGAEGSVHLVFPTKPKSPLSSLLAFKRSLIKSNPSSDRFSAYDLDQLLEIDPPSVENSHEQSELVDLGEQMAVSDELKSPFFKQKDNSESAKGGSPEVTIEELSHASERYVSDGSSKMGMRDICDSTRSDVDTEVIEGGSNVDNTVRDKMSRRPHADTDTCEKGDNYCDKLEDRLEEAVAGTEPELNAEDSSLENLNSRNELDQLHSPAAPEHPTDDLFKSVDSGLDKHNEVMQEHLAISMDKHTEAKSRPGRKRKNKEVSKRQSLAGAATCQSGLDTHNEIMQEHPAVSMDKQTEAKSRPERKRKNKEFSKRQSLAGSGTTWQSGVRRSTRFRTRPLHYWKGERLLYGRVHDTLTTVIGIKYLSPGKGMTVKSFVSDEYIDLVESAALH